MASQGPSSPSLLKPAATANSAFAQSMGVMTTYLRALESERGDRIINDPFAEPLSRQERQKTEKIQANMGNELHSRPGDFIAFRTRYLDDALASRDPRILQVVILGAGLDTRAYRLESLRGCHVFEVDRSAPMFAHKSAVMEGLDAPLAAERLDYIVLNLAEEGLEESLRRHGFNAAVPTFWTMEGLLPYIEREPVEELLKTIDELSAPGSELWADIPGRIVADPDEWGTRHMKYGEDDPVHGVLSVIPWVAEVQASLGEVGCHFGRKWTPMASPKNKLPAPFAFVVGKKPSP